MGLLDFTFLGTGTSENIPNVYCLTSPDPCSVCKLAITPLPASEGFSLLDVDENISSSTLPPPFRYSKNRRRNTSGLIRHTTLDNITKNILIDCGKTFYNSALEWFNHYKIETIDAVLLTHPHADAILGLDDLRMWTLRSKKQIPVYCTKNTFDVVKTTFPYLVDSEFSTGGGAKLAFIIFDQDEAFRIDGLEVIPLPVHHGTIGKSEPFICLGFRFEIFSYISDTNFIPPETRLLIEGSTVIVVDALKDESHASHLSLDEAIECVRSFETVQRAYLTGFCHMLGHEEVRLRCLATENIRIRPAFDGLQLCLS